MAGEAVEVWRFDKGFAITAHLRADVFLNDVKDVWPIGFVVVLRSRCEACRQRACTHALL
jgi:hypothetical protein